MNKKLKNLILRSYIALAQGERFIPSEIGDCVDFVGAYSGRLIDSYPVVQLEYLMDYKFRERFCAEKGITKNEFFELMIIPKPSMVQNQVYSTRLRRVFGTGTLRFMPEFDKDGVFILPSYRGYFQPKIDEGLITKLHFYDMSELNRKAA